MELVPQGMLVRTPGPPRPGQVLDRLLPSPAREQERITQ